MQGDGLSGSRDAIQASAAMSHFTRVGSLMGLLLLACLRAEAEDDAFVKRIGNTRHSELAVSVDSISEGGFVLAGSEWSSLRLADGHIWRLDMRGDLVWSYAYGGADVDYLYSVRAGPDGGVVAAGRTSSFGAKGADGWILRLDGDGHVLWQKRYGGTGDDLLASIRETTDGDFIAIGETNSFSGDVLNYDYWILRLDPSGAIRWEKTYGSDGWDTGYAIEHTSDAGFVAVGEVDALAGGRDMTTDSSNAWVLKLDMSGNIVWQAAYGGLRDDTATSVAETPDGRYVVAGDSDSWTQEWADLWVFKLDRSGKVLWQRTYGGDQAELFPRSICVTPGGNILTVGKTTSFGSGSASMWALRLTPKGDVRWQASIGGAGESDGLGAVYYNGAAYLCGYTSSFGDGSESDTLLARIPASGRLTPDCDFVSATDGRVRKPNPIARPLPAIQVTDVTSTVRDTSAQRRTRSELDVSICGE